MVALLVVAVLEEDVAKEEDAPEVVVVTAVAQKSVLSLINALLIFVEWRA
jgi:hypothetical protein